MHNKIAALLQSQESRRPSSGTGPFGIFAKPAGTDKSCVRLAPKAAIDRYAVVGTARRHQRPSLKRRAAPPMRLSRRGASKTAAADLTHRRGCCGRGRGIPDGRTLRRPRHAPALRTVGYNDTLPTQTRSSQTPNDKLPLTAVGPVGKPGSLDDIAAIAAWGRHK